MILSGSGPEIRAYPSSLNSGVTPSLRCLRGISNLTLPKSPVFFSSTSLRWSQTATSFNAFGGLESSKTEMFTNNGLGLMYSSHEPLSGCRNDSSNKAHDYLPTVLLPKRRLSISHGETSLLNLLDNHCRMNPHPSMSAFSVMHIRTRPCISLFTSSRGGQFRSRSSSCSAPVKPAGIYQ